MKKILLIVLSVCGIACSRDESRGVKNEAAKRNAFVLDSFFGYKFGEKSSTPDYESAYEDLAKPFRHFRHVKKSYTNQGTLYKLTFLATDDSWDSADEAEKVSSLIEKKYGIRMIKDYLKKEFRNDNVNIKIEVWHKLPSSQEAELPGSEKEDCVDGRECEMIMEVENLAIRRNEAKNVRLSVRLPADKDSDRL